MPPRQHSARTRRQPYGNASWTSCLRGPPHGQGEPFFEDEHRHEPNFEMRIVSVADEGACERMVQVRSG